MSFNGEVLSVTITQTQIECKQMAEHDKSAYMWKGIGNRENFSSYSIAEYHRQWQKCHTA